MPDTCSACLLHAIQEHKPCCIWYGLRRWQKDELPSRQFENLTFQDIRKEQRKTQLWYLKTCKKTFAHGIKTFPSGEHREEWKALEAVFLCQDSVPSHQLSSSFSQRSQQIDTTILMPVQCQVMLTASMSPRQHQSVVDCITWMRSPRSRRKSLRSDFLKKNKTIQGDSTYMLWCLCTF